MVLLGINGRLKSGKDTAYEILQAEFGTKLTLKREGFADRMKLSGVRALGYAPANIEEALYIANRIKDAGVITTVVKADIPNVEVDTADLGLFVRITGREYWQRYGTEAHREVFQENFWVDALLPTGKGWPSENKRALEARFPDTDGIVITDVRFDNEAQRILDLGGEVWKIDADKRLGPLPADAHPSERGLSPLLLTRIIENNDTLGAFTSRATTAFREDFCS